MKTHRIKVKVPVEKRGFFGIKKTVYKERVIEVDDKTYKKMKKEQKATQRSQRSYSIEEMMLYDEVFDEWED